jgi:threonine dehydrogenase-like Zn-dependent dehydrogenase
MNYPPLANQLNGLAIDPTPMKLFPVPAAKAIGDPELTHKVLEFHGAKDVRIGIKPRPMVTNPKDCIVRITSTTICGSDLHLYHAEFQGLPKGYVLGHEPMGIVSAVGPEVKDIKVGDRVVVSAVLVDGECWYCKNGLFSLCEGTNPNNTLEGLYGHKLAGIIGYSELLGGFDGGQAEYLRVPFGDNNCLKVPDELPDEKVLFLSDIVCTGYHGTELGAVSPGQTVAIWGCGPVGLMACMWSWFRGARRVIAIDIDEGRLNVAKNKLHCEVIDASKVNTVDALKALCPTGPDVAIECVGFRFAQDPVHKIERAIRLETDTPEILTQCIKSLRKGGTLAIIGDYYLTANQFPIGAMMEKAIVVRGGQVFVQRYWKQLLQYIRDGKVDPSFVVTHTMPLDRAPEAYKLFDEHKDFVLKVILKPSMIESM